MSDINNAYSPFKIVHHRDRLESLYVGEQIVPTQVHFVISDYCNHDCHFCAYRMSNYISNELFSVDGNRNPIRKIETEKCFEIIEDLRELGVNAVQFTGGGEPTAHPDHIKIFRKALDNSLDVALVTNGTVLKQADLYSEFSWVRFSIDASRKETYSKTRNVKPYIFDKTISNLEKVVKECSASKTIVGAGFVVTKENYKEIEEFAKMMSDIGVDNIRYSAMFNPDDFKYYEKFYKTALEFINKAKKLETKNFKVFNNFGERIEDLKQQSPDYSKCYYMEFVTYIGGDLNVYTCCNNAYSKHGLIGSIKDQKFSSLWNSAKKKSYFSSFNAKNCERCMFNNKNRFIGYAVSKEPQHVNFV